jgi:predicted DCC family thiol-disulfide oxidoreductase YuxK
MPTPLKNKDQKYILYYDAHCLMCSKAMQFIRKIDTKNHIWLLPIAQLPADTALAEDTVVFIDDRQHVYYFSAAVIQCLYATGGVFRLVYVAYIIPKFMRDALYRFVARNRKRFFKYSTCSLPLNNK